MVAGALVVGASGVETEAEMAAEGLAVAMAAVEKEVVALAHSREGREEAKAVRVGAVRVEVAKAVEERGEAVRAVARAAVARVAGCWH